MKNCNIDMNQSALIRARRAPNLSFLAKKFQSLQQSQTTPSTAPQTIPAASSKAVSGSSTAISDDVSARQLRKNQIFKNFLAVKYKYIDSKQQKA